jgi:hypothetical protein
MSQSDILTLIDAEIALLQQARALLAGAGKRGLKLKSVPAAKPKRKRKKLSKEGRAHIVAAQKARWAKQKKAAK